MFLPAPKACKIAILAFFLYQHQQTAPPLNDTNDNHQAYNDKHDIFAY